MAILPRTLEAALRQASRQYPVVTLTGPRQSGKTTLCRRVFPDKAYVNLERPDVRAFATEDPRGFLAQHHDGAILDEIQRAPELTSYIQSLVDESPEVGRFILTGSQQFEVIEGVSQSLAGRTAILKLLPFALEELAGHHDVTTLDHLILTGFYPRIYDRGLDPTEALGYYLESYVERDLLQLIHLRDLTLFEKFVRLCAGRIGQLLNLQGLGNDVGISHTTARAWLSLLEASYLVFRLPPYFRNLGKRLIKSPKLYFYDVGLAAYLLGLESELHVRRHPLHGALVENLVVAEAMKHALHRGRRPHLFFYRDRSGHEVDLVVETGPHILPIEIKAGATLTPDFFKGLHHFAHLHPDLPHGMALIYGGNETQMRTDLAVYPFHRVHDLLRRCDDPQA